MWYVLMPSLLLAVGAGVAIIIHLRAHRDGRVPTWCFLASTRRRSITLYAMFVLGSAPIAMWSAGRARSLLETIPAILFSAVGALALVALARLGLSARHVGAALREYQGRWVEAGVGRDGDGAVLWEWYLEVDGHHARIDTPHDRMPPAIRAPAEERAVCGRVWVHGPVVVGSPIAAWLERRWVLTLPAAVGGLDVIGALETSNLERRSL